MPSNDHHNAAERAANHSVRSWLRSLLHRPSDPYAELGAASPSSCTAAASTNASSSTDGTDMISFHHTMEDVDRPHFAPPPRSFSGGSSSGSLSYEAAARRTIAQPIATPRAASQALFPHGNLVSPPDLSTSPPKSPRLGRSLSIGVASLTDKLHHQRRASETFRRMRSGSTERDKDAAQPSLSRSLSNTLDAIVPLVSSPPPLEGEESVSSPFSPTICHKQSSTGLVEETDHSAPTQARQSSTNSADLDRTTTTSTTQVAPPLSPIAAKSASVTSTTSPNDAANELLLPEGEQMLKVTHKKVKPRTFKLDPDRGQILWESKKNNRVNLESIREVRFGPSAASYRTSLNISSAHEPRWLTIIYQNGGIYKALHLIALTDASLSRWRSSLLHLQSLRRELIGAVGASSSIEHRRHLWMRHHWKDADQSNDEKLSIDEVMQLCRRLGIESNKTHLRRCFNLADWRNRGYLDFHDFQHFVSLLKQRADVQTIFAAWADQPLDQPVRSSSLSSAGTVESDFAAASREQPFTSPDNSTADASVLPTSAVSDTTLVLGLEPCRTRAISIENFRRFVHEEQGNREFSDSQIDDLFRRHCNSRLSASTVDAAVERAQMDYDGFLDFLSSSDNPPLLDQLPLFSTMFSDPVDMPVLSKPACSAAKEACGGSAPSSNVLQPECRQPQRTPSRAFADTTDELIAAGASNSMANTRKVAAHLRKSTVKHDMSRPLSEYYISSSHNTYLVGGQWKGDSTVEGYIRALLQGARSVELDCWDGPNNVPQITHGRTLTSRVSFQDVISAIARYAFVTSPYPLILSLEVHADPPQQEVMARILRDTLGEMLLSQPLGSRAMPSPDDVLPSPEDLKFKVLVKAKNVSAADAQRNPSESKLPIGIGSSSQEKEGTSIVPSVVLEPSTSATDTTTTTDSEIESRLASAKQLVRRATRRGRRGEASSAGVPRERIGDAVDPLDAQRETPTTGGRSSKHAKKMMSTALASLLVYTIGVKCRGFNKKESYATQHMVSLSEKTALKMIRDSISNEALIKHNRSHLTRVYPSMMSFARLHASRNFVPLDMWATGCQLVALNWQTTDLGFELNQAMFSRNGRCGYVLKPAALRVKEQGKTLAGKAVRFRLDITIVSAQQLPKKSKVGSGKDKDKSSTQDSREPIDPFVVVSLLAPSCWGKQPKSSLGSSQLLRTPTVKGNGFSPEWNTEMRVLIDVPAGASNELVALVEASKASAAGDALTHPEMERLSRGLLDLCFVRFEIFDDDLNGDATAATSAVPVGDAVTTPQPAHSASSLELARQTSPDSNAMAGKVASPGPTANASHDTATAGRARSGSETSSASSTASIDAESIAAYSVSVGALQQGYRHLPLYDHQLSQFLFSTLFVHSRLRLVGIVDARSSSKPS